jgi:hypothetical protein
MINQRWSNDAIDQSSDDLTYEVSGNASWAVFRTRAIKGQAKACNI